MNGRMFTFVAGHRGPWRIERVNVVAGEPLPPATHIDIVNELLPDLPESASWFVRGVTSNERYVTRDERASLRANQPALGRADALCAALIPIRKSAAWWDLAQDQRRALLEEQSAHIRIGMEYLPAVARRLHHSRDLGEPFDFVTWFEFSPEHATSFDRLVGRLRASAEWTYVDREVDIRLVREIPVG